MTAPIVLIATPAYSGLSHEYVDSLLASQAECQVAGVGIGWTCCSGMSALGLARAQIARGFLGTDASHLLMIDSDIGWVPGDVLRLLGHGLPFVAGIAPCRQSAKQGIWTVVGLPGPHRVENGLVEVGAVGFSFALVRRDVFEALVAAYPERWDEQTQVYDFYPTGKLDGKYLREDTSFCHLWRKIGGEIWVDPTVRLRHQATIALTGDPMTVFGLVTDV